MDNNLYMIASKIVGILSNAIVVSLVAVIATYWFNECSAKKRQKEKRKGLLRALLTEVNALRALIADRKKAFVIPDKDNVANYNFTYLPVSYSYWTVYESRCAELGIIEIHELTDRIIRTYVDVKGLFENLKDLEECTRLYASYATTSNDNAMTLRLIQAHHDYCLFISKQQVPMVEEGLCKLACVLEKELGRLDKG